jgi:hypothetical protein
MTGTVMTLSNVTASNNTATNGAWLALCPASSRTLSVVVLRDGTVQWGGSAARSRH